MAHFASEAEVYEQIGRRLSDLLADETTAAQLRSADGVVQYRHSEPDATITLDLRESAEPRVDLGETELQPEVVLAMDADVAHRLWSGEANIVASLARGEIRTKGPVAKVLRLVALMGPASGPGATATAQPGGGEPVEQDGAEPAEQAPDEDA